MSVTLEDHQKLLAESEAHQYITHQGELPRKKRLALYAKMEAFCAETASSKGEERRAFNLVILFVDVFSSMIGVWFSGLNALQSLTVLHHNETYLYSCSFYCPKEEAETILSRIDRINTLDRRGKFDLKRRVLRKEGRRSGLFIFSSICLTISQKIMPNRLLIDIEPLDEEIDRVILFAQLNQKS